MLISGIEKWEVGYPKVWERVTRESLLEKMTFGKDLKEMREQAVQLCRRREPQVEGSARQQARGGRGRACASQGRG